MIVLVDCLRALFYAMRLWKGGRREETEIRRHEAGGDKQQYRSIDDDAVCQQPILLWWDGIVPSQSRLRNEKKDFIKSSSS